MLSLILGFAPSILNGVVNYLARARDAQVEMYKARYGASHETAVAAVTAYGQVASRWWFVAAGQALLLWSVAIYIAKLLVWDKVVGAFVGCVGHTAPDTCMLFSTDDVGANLAWVVSAVVLSAFGGGLADKFLKGQ